MTLHWMTPGIDMGDIAFQTMFPIRSEDTPVSLTSKCVKLGMKMLEELLASASKGLEIPRRSQNASQREYFGKELPFDGRVEWGLPAAQLERFVRACDYGPFKSPWGSPRELYKGQQVGLVKVLKTNEMCHAAPGTVGDRSDGEVWVACRDEWLRISRARIDGKRVPVAEAFEAGQRIEDGAH